MAMALHRPHTRQLCSLKIGSAVGALSRCTQALGLILFSFQLMGAFARLFRSRFDGRMKRPEKITFGEMRSSGVRGVLIYCADYHCSHSIAIIGDRWPDDTRLTDLEPRFACSACGKRGADVRLDWQSAERPEAR
jgi:hypothetical protein